MPTRGQGGEACLYGEKIAYLNRNFKKMLAVAAEKIQKKEGKLG